MIMCTHKHHVFFVEMTTELAVTLRCNKIFLPIHLRQSSFVYISQVIFHTFDNSFYLLITGSWPKKIYCDFSLTQLHCDLESLFCLLYQLFLCET